MNFNKKAQNITNPWPLLLILTIIALISTAFFSFGQDLASDPSSAINDESRAYIYNNSGFQLPDRSADDATDVFYASETASEGNLKDYALEFQFYREKSSTLRSIFQTIYNLPVFFLKMLNIPIVGTWSIMVAIINGLIWVLIFYLIYRIIRGIIK
jgi:hypothetical protein